MWEIDLADQIKSFLLSVLLGACLSVVFYTLESFRIAKDLKKGAVFFLDMLFFTVAGFITFCFLIARSNGEIRGYILFGEAMGFLIFRMLFSRFYIKVLSTAIRTIDGIFSHLLNRLRALIGKIYGFFEKSFENLKNMRKKG